MVRGWLIEHQVGVNTSAVVAALTIIAWSILQFSAEPFFWMSEAGVVLYDMALAWFTAWAFQYLVIARPDKRERLRFNNVVAPLVDDLAAHAKEFYLTVAPPHVTCVTVPMVDVAQGKPTSILGQAQLSQQAPGWVDPFARVIAHLLLRAAEQRRRLDPFLARLDPVLLIALREEEARARTADMRLRLAVASSSTDLTKLDDALRDWLASVDHLCAQRLRLLGDESPQSVCRSEGSQIVFDDLLAIMEGLR